MLYRTLRAAANVALRWYYADIVVQGAERIPATGPLIIASNHPNALVDALLVTTALRRRVRLTARATLFEHPVLAPLLRRVGVVPLRRVKDELAARHGGHLAVERNADSFRQVPTRSRRAARSWCFPKASATTSPTWRP